MSDWLHKTLFLMHLFLLPNTTLLAKYTAQCSQFSKKIHSGIVFSLFLIFFKIQARALSKFIVLIKKSENIVRFAIACICNWLSFEYIFLCNIQNTFIQIS